MKSRSHSHPWFKTTFGFEESSYEETKKQFKLSSDGTELTSLRNNRKFHIGLFEVLSRKDLHERKIKMEDSAGNAGTDLGRLNFSNISGTVEGLIQNVDNEGSVFQAASQFNCLEMVGPGVRPEDGITRYKFDHTQGPACALACPAGTLFRNYFVNKCLGQAAPGKQINTLDTIENILKNKQHAYWNVKNGYCMPTTNCSMSALNRRFEIDARLVQQIHDNLKVGVHWDTEVERQPKWKRCKDSGKWISKVDSKTVKHNVCQVYVSACPVAYTKSTKSSDWAPFASLILKSCYESTLEVANILALQRGKRVKVFLTQVGGGAFGNRKLWILSAIENALKKFENAPLDVYLVHYSTIPPGGYQKLETKIQKTIEAKE